MEALIDLSRMILLRARWKYNIDKGLKPLPYIDIRWVAKGGKTESYDVEKTFRASTSLGVQQWISDRRPVDVGRWMLDGLIKQWTTGDKRTPLGESPELVGPYGGC
jgi:hypothetical protein